MLGCHRPHYRGVPELLILKRSEVERLLDLEALLSALEAGFKAISAGRTSVPARVASLSPDGLLGVMPAWLPGTLSTKLVSVFPANHDLGLPSHQAMVALFDERSGTPLALLDGTYITAIRTAAASGVATRLLARPGARRVAILGGGVQGRSHERILREQLGCDDIRIATRSGGDSFEEAVREADIVCCCTDTLDPILRAEWLRPGTHLNSVGGSPRGRGELPADLFGTSGARLFVESRTVFSPAPSGAPELAALDPTLGTELGEVLAGSQPGRSSADEVTVYKSVGHAAEDAVAARLVYDRALAEGAGVTVTI
jgi:ornithine cyclodeaminase/alanine dehydrogenase-like protein (mu-crystallin family)